MDFSKVIPTLLLGWNQWFYFTTIIGLLLGIILFGLPYVSFRGIDQMRLQKFFGRITPYAFGLLILTVLVFIFESVYSGIVGIQLLRDGTSDISKINGNMAYWSAIVISGIFILVSSRWLLTQWRQSATDNLPVSESAQLRGAISRLTSKLDKLDKLDKIDKLILTLDKQIKQQPITKNKGKMK